MIDANLKQRKPRILSICGPSCSGKSQLAKSVASLSNAIRVPTDYFLMPRDSSGCLTWDWALLRSLFELPIGTATSAPDLDFETMWRRRRDGGIAFTIQPVMICDAMAPYPDSDMVVLLETAQPVRRERMRARDRRWGTTVAERWAELDATWRATARTVRPDMVLDGTMPVDVLARQVVGRFRIWNEENAFMDRNQQITIGTKVVSLDGEHLGTVREVEDYYILIDQPDTHDDLEVPSDAIGEFRDGVLRLTVNRSALSAVDDEESAHREIEESDAGMARPE